MTFPFLLRFDSTPRSCADHPDPSSVGGTIAATAGDGSSRRAGDRAGRVSGVPAGLNWFQDGALKHMKANPFSLRRLRWKLTFSYTLGTVVALLVLELILVSALVAFLNSELLPRLVVQNVRDEVAPRLEKPLGQNPPDTEKIRDELVGFAENSDVRGADQAPRGPTGFGDYTADQGALFVVDDERRLLVSVPEMRAFPEGQSFDAGSVR